MWIMLTIMTSFPFRVHNADYYMQEAKKLKHKADALVRLKIQYFFSKYLFCVSRKFHVKVLNDMRVYISHPK